MRDRIGSNGCGGFGLFALQQFVQVPGIRLAGMAGTARPAAEAAARRFGLEDVVEVERLLALPSVDIIYIATPPFLHYEQAKQALEAGKHVICEKPLALTVEQADELIAIARRSDRLLVANLMQRYNPLFDIVAQLIEQQAARRAAARLLRELRVRRKPAGRPLVLGSREKRRDLCRARRAFLRSVCRLARRG